MSKELIAIFEYLEREKGIKRDFIIKAIEEALHVAALKSVSGASNVTVKIHPKTGNIEVYSEKEIVDEVEVASQEISLEEARKIDPECSVGQFIDVVCTPKDFGRIAAQKARMVITGRLRSAEREVIYEEYRHRIHDLLSGTVKKIVRGANLIVDLGKVEAILPASHYPKTEQFNVGSKVLALLLEVRDTESGGAEVVLSRNHPEFVKQLLIQEVPEINDGTVEVLNIVRHPGYRTKLTVRSHDPKVDPVGACVGMRGNRIKNVSRELHNEKIDIIPFAADPVELLQNSLSPILIRKVSVNEEEGVVSIVVNDDDFPMVIGKKGWNADLNGRLIGYHLEVKRLSEYQESMVLKSRELAEADDPSLDLPLQSIEGINRLIIEHLITEGYSTPRALLTATPEQLSAIPGISDELADRILEQIRKQRMNTVG